LANRFVVDCGDHLITHDGYIQIGIFHHSLEDHLRLNSEVEWQVTYWMPDVFTNRYKRLSYQQHMIVNAGSPKTDGSAESINK
jgi:hypothetical protein